MTPTRRSIPQTPPSTSEAPTAELRLEVGRLRSRQRGARFDSTLKVGTLGGRHECHVIEPQDVSVLDTGMRTDLLSRLLEGHCRREATVPVRPATVAVWLTRPGDPVLQDTDLAWLAAADAACGAMGVQVEGVWTVTRTGWLDVRSGESRTWRRLRL